MFEINRPGHEFYIILTGEVAFYGNHTDKKDGELIKKETQRIENEQEIGRDTSQKRFKSSFPGVPKIEKIHHTRVKITKSGVYVFYHDVLMDELNRYSTGAEFGDLALKESGGLRQTTVVGLHDTHFLVLSKHSYDRIIGEHKANHDMRIMNIWKSLYYFEGVHHRILQACTINQKVEYYSLRDVIFDWKRPTGKIYIIFEGQVTLVRKRKYYEDEEDSEKRIINKMLDDVQQEESSLHQLQRATSKHDYEDICVRETGQTFAEEFVVLGIQPDYKVVANSTKCVVASIRGEDLKKKIFQFMPSCYFSFERSIRERRHQGYLWKKNISKILQNSVDTGNLESSPISSKSIQVIRGKKPTRKILLKGESLSKDSSLEFQQQSKEYNTIVKKLGNRMVQLLKYKSIDNGRSCTHRPSQPVSQHQNFPLSTSRRASINLQIYKSSSTTYMGSNHKASRSYSINKNVLSQSNNTMYKKRYNVQAIRGKTKSIDVNRYMSIHRCNENHNGSSIEIPTPVDRVDLTARNNPMMKRLFRLTGY